MSDSWAMNLAREVQVYSSPADSNHVSPINALGVANIADDGYSTSNSVEVDAYSEKGQEECQNDITDEKCQKESQKTRNNHMNKRSSSRKQIERNMKQRERKAVHSYFFALLKELLITTSLIKVVPKKGIRGFTQHDILIFTRKVIEHIISENPQLQNKLS